MFNLLDEINNPKGTPLKYDEFKKYKISSLGVGQWRFKFENNYGASVVKHWGSYGYEEDKFELAVIYFDENGKDYITYNTPITDNVIGWLDNNEVLELLKKIKNLKED